MYSLVWNIFMIFFFFFILVFQIIKNFFLQLVLNYKTIFKKALNSNFLMRYLKMAGLKKNWRFYLFSFSFFQLMKNWRIPPIDGFLIFFYISKTQKLNFILFLIINIFKCMYNINALFWVISWYAQTKTEMITHTLYIYIYIYRERERERCTNFCIAI